MNQHHANEPQLVQQVLSHPKFRTMAKQKAILGYSFSAIIFFVYVAYIWVIGTNPQLFAQKVFSGSMSTWGIYIGIFVILFSFLITLIYVVLANGKFEQMTQEVVKEITQENQ